MKNIKRIKIYNNPNGSYIQIEYLDEIGLRRESFDTQRGFKEIIDFINERNIESASELLDTVSFYDYDNESNAYQLLDKNVAINTYSELLSEIMKQKVIDVDSSEVVEDNELRLDVTEINYYKYGTSYLARFVYSDGTYSLLNFHDANNYLELLINEGKVDRNFIDNDIHFYRTVDDDNYIEVDFDNYKANDSILDIKDIVLNTIEDGDDYLTITYNNGEVEEVSASLLDDIVREYSKLTGISIADLFDNHFIQENHIANDIEEEIEDEESNELDNEDIKEENLDSDSSTKESVDNDKKLEADEELEEAPKKTILGRIKGFIMKHPKVFAVALAGIISFIGFKIYSYFNVKQDTNITHQTDDEFTDADYAKIVAESGNSERVGALSKIHDYMVKHYVDGVENRDADIEYEPKATDIMAYYLAYNDLDQENIDKIFGDEKIDYESMKVAIKNLVKHDAIDHTMQKNSLGKELILNSSDAEKFYNKYENMFIKINKADNDEKKIELLTEFNDEVRKDLPNMDSNNAVTPSTTSNYDGVEAYMYMIKEFYLAADKYNLDVPNSLTHDEKEYINGIYDKIIEPKLIDIVDKHNNEYNFDEELDGPNYSLFMDKVQDDYITLFNNLYIPDEVEEEKDETLNAEEESIFTATTTNTNNTSTKSSNRSSSYSSGTSTTSSASSSATSVEESDPEEENIYDKGYNKQKDNSKKSKKKEKAKDVNVKKNSSKKKDVEDIEDVEDVKIDTSSDVEDIEDVSIDYSDVVVEQATEVAEDVSVEDVVEDTSVVQDTAVQDVEVQDTTGVDVETVDTVEDVVLEVNEDADVQDTDVISDTDNNNISDVTVVDTADDVVVSDTTDVVEEDVVIKDVEDTDTVLTQEEIADTIVEIMASEDVQDVEIEDSYQYTR